MLVKMCFQRLFLDLQHIENIGEGGALCKWTPSEVVSCPYCRCFLCEVLSTSCLPLFLFVKSMSLLFFCVCGAFLFFLGSRGCLCSYFLPLRVSPFRLVGKVFSSWMKTLVVNEMMALMIIVQS